MPSLSVPEAFFARESLIFFRQGFQPCRLCQEAGGGAFLRAPLGAEGAGNRQEPDARVDACCTLPKHGPAFDRSCVLFVVVQLGFLASDAGRVDALRSSLLSVEVAIRKEGFAGFFRL